MATNTKSSPTDMTWLHEWITRCLAGPKPIDDPDFDDDMRLMQETGVRPQFMAITADTAILGDLTSIYQAMLDESTSLDAHLSCQKAVKKFLTNSSWFPNVPANIRHAKDPSLSSDRSETVADLDALAKAANRLANQVKRLKQPLGGATSIRYLQKRFDNGNPVGFSSHRHGYTTYHEKSSGPTDEARLQGLLECFADEALEVAQDLKAKMGQRRETAGKHADEQTFIDLMLVNAQILATAKKPKPNFALIAKIGSHIFSNGLDVSTIRKRYKQ